MHILASDRANENKKEQEREKYSVSGVSREKNSSRRLQLIILLRCSSHFQNVFLFTPRSVETHLKYVKLKAAVLDSVDTKHSLTLFGKNSFVMSKLK